MLRISRYVTALALFLLIGVALACKAELSESDLPTMSGTSALPRVTAEIRVELIAAPAEQIDLSARDFPLGWSYHGLGSGSVHEATGANVGQGLSGATLLELAITSNVQVFGTLQEAVDAFAVTVSQVESGTRTEAVSIGDEAIVSSLAGTWRVDFRYRNVVARVMAVGSLFQEARRSEAEKWAKVLLQRMQSAPRQVPTATPVAPTSEPAATPREAPILAAEQTPPAMVADSPTEIPTQLPNVTPTQSPTAVPTPTLIPKIGLIGYASSGKFFVSDRDGRRATEYGGRFAWSPDGEHVVMSCEIPDPKGGSFGVCVANKDGSAMKGLFNLNCGRCGVSTLFWSPSPDGERIGIGIAYGGSMSAESEVIDTLGNKVQGTCGIGSWSPNGRLAVIQQAGTGFSNFTVCDRANGRRLLAVSEDMRNVSPTWSPDSGTIAFLRSAGSNRWQVFFVPMEREGKPRRLAADIGAGAGETVICGVGLWWSPNGGFLAFVMGESGTDRQWDCQSGDLYVVRPDGTGLSQLTFDGTVTGDIAWAPDSTLIAYGKGRDIWVVATDGTDDRLLMINAYSPAWQPGQ